MTDDIHINDPLDGGLFGANDDLSLGEDFAIAEENKGMGQALAWSAAGLAAVTGYFSALTKRQTLKNKAVSLEFQGTMADMQARDYEDQALLLIEAGNSEISRRGMQAGQERAQAIVGSARRGVLLGAGSSAEVRASMEIVRRMEARTIKTNVRRQSQQARRAALNSRLSAQAARVSAQNARGAASAVSPGLVALGSAGNMFGQAASTGVFAGES
jgi:hypothetical protein